jgi:hypothetical protein
VELTRFEGEAGRLNQYHIHIHIDAPLGEAVGREQQIGEAVDVSGWTTAGQKGALQEVSGPTSDTTQRRRPPAEVWHLAV